LLTGANARLSIAAGLCEKSFLASKVRVKMQSPADRSDARVQISTRQFGDPSFEAWRQEFAARLARVELTQLHADQNFHLNLLGLALPSVSITQYSGENFSLQRTRQLLKDDQDHFHFTIALAGQFNVMHANSQRAFTPRQAFVYVSNNECRCIAQKNMAALNVSLSRDVARSISPHFERLSRNDFSIGSPMLPILQAYLQSLLGLPEAMPEATRHLADQQCRELLAHLLHPASDLAHAPAFAGIKAARLQAVLKMLAAKFDNPDLSAKLVGEKLGVSARYVQQLMEGTGCTFSSYVLELRLERAWRRLADPLQAHKNISDICYAVGFSSLPYFNRAFRAYFGCTPKDARQHRAKAG